MEWRADAAYEKAQRKGAKTWRKSFTRSQWTRWQVERHWAVALGATAAAACWLLSR